MPPFTHPRIFKTPTPVEHALSQMQALVDLPQVVMLSEGDGYLDRLSAVASPARTQGGAPFMTHALRRCACTTASPNCGPLTGTSRAFRHWRCAIP